jgi:hypothetical protein
VTPLDRDHVHRPTRLLHDRVVSQMSRTDS